MEDPGHKMNPTGRGYSVPMPCSGIQFFPEDPRPEEFNIRDIAHKLAFQCRYGGGVTQYYSVAEHCVILSYAVPRGYELDALLHDRAEAYIQDLIRPMKRKCQPWYGEIERRIETVSAQVFKVRDPIPDIVMEHDYRICLDEKRQAYSCSYEAENKFEEGEPLGVKLNFWGPYIARGMFMQRYSELTR